jgi:biopolymer transport protein ExbB
MIDTTLNYFNNISAISIGVLLVLSVYLISVFWVFFVKLFTINSKISQEKNNLSSLLARDSKVNPLSKLGQCVGSKSVNKELLQMCEISLVREASTGISWLAIVSSTAPFIGLFGTVVGILESFAKFSTVSKVAFSTIAPVISEALVATAAGIFVAIFAYTFHQILTRKVYELNTYFNSQIKVLVSKD